MKKRLIKLIIALMIIVGIAFLYAHIDKKIPIYDKTVDTSLYGNMSELTQDLIVTQEFVCKEDVLDGLNVQFATYGNVLSSTYTYQIIDPETNEVIREGLISAADIANGKFYKISFEQIEECRNKTYRFVFFSEDAVPGNALTIYNVPKGSEQATLWLNDEEFQQNTLALRTFSHMFDWETFVTVICCLVYLYIFIIILFKFFS